MPMATAEECQTFTLTWNQGEARYQDPPQHFFGVTADYTVFEINAKANYIIWAGATTAAGRQSNYSTQETSQDGAGKLLYGSLKSGTYAKVEAFLSSCKDTPAPQSVSLAPYAITAGQPVTVTYRGAANTTLDILARTQPATEYSRIGSVTLDGIGIGRSTHKPHKNTRITARASDGQLSDAAPVIGVRSVASLNVRRVSTRTFAFSGTVSPALNNRLVNLYRDGILTAQGRTNSSGVYSISKTLPADNYTFHAATPDDTYNLGALSRSLEVRIY